MANASVSRIGQINAAGDTQALFLKVFSGEVLTAFEETNVMMNRHNVRTISSGKSAQFPTSGKIGAEYHVPGNEINGLTLRHGERVITIDDLLISHAFISNIDEAKNHYDVRSIYSTEIGRQLAYTMDKHVLQTGVLAARGTGSFTGDIGGANFTDATVGTDSDKLVAAIYAAAEEFDEKDIPQDERYFFVRPQQYYLLAQNTKVLYKEIGGTGSIADGNVLKIAGFEIVKANHLPGAVVAPGSLLAGTGDKYAGDFSVTVGLALQKQAVGTVKLMDLAMEMEYDIRRQGTLMVAKYAVGHGILRPGCAFEVRTGAPA